MTQRVRRHRLSRDDGRPRQDAAPAGPRRHPRAARQARRPRVARPNTASRSIDLVVVNLYPFAKAAAEPGDDVRRSDRADRHRRARHGARRGQELPRRARASSTRPTTRGCWRRSGGAAAVPRRSASNSRARPSRTPAPTTRRSPSDARAGDDGRRRRHAHPGRRARTFPAAGHRVRTRRIRDLRYGENPHQPAAWYAGRSDRASAASTILQGKELSFTNLLDLDAAARIVLEFDEPAAGVIKHTNPCGVATGARRGRGLRPRPRGRCAVGVRRHHRPESHARRRDRRGDRRRPSSRR